MQIIFFLKFQERQKSLYLIYSIINSKINLQNEKDFL